MSKLPLLSTHDKPEPVTSTFCESPGIIITMPLRWAYNQPLYK
jgi:hypothetical protein